MLCTARRLNRPSPTPAHPPPGTKKRKTCPRLGYAEHTQLHCLASTESLLHGAPSACVLATDCPLACVMAPAQCPSKARWRATPIRRPVSQPEGPYPWQPDVYVTTRPDHHRPSCPPATTARSHCHPSPQAWCLDPSPPPAHETLSSYLCAFLCCNLLAELSS